MYVNKYIQTYIYTEKESEAYTVPKTPFKALGGFQPETPQNYNWDCEYSDCDGDTFIGFDKCDKCGREKK